MAQQVSATKGNLLKIKQSLELSELGYELMDRKRNVLIREMMSLMDDVRLLKQEISTAYREAYFSLQQANISLGLISEIAKVTPLEDSVQIRYRSAMGVEIPKVMIEEKPLKMEYPIEATNSRLDEAYLLLLKAKNLTVKLAEIDNSVFRLAKAIQKTQKRANALHNVVIPEYKEEIKRITLALEEKEREEFSRLKVIKNRKNSLTKQMP